MDIGDRVTRANEAPARRGGLYVLAWTQQTLRGRDNPLVEAALQAGRRLGLPVLVYHGLREDYPHASARLHRFIVGASREMAMTLAGRGIACVQHVEREGCRERGLVYRLAAQAAEVFVDEHYAFVPKTQALRFAACADVVTWLVDTARLVPTRMLPDGLSSTREFRSAHSSRRIAARAALEVGGEAEPVAAPFAGSLPFVPDRLDAMDDAALDALVARCAVDHALPASIQHPATGQELDARLGLLGESVAARYAWTRNNPALPFGTSMLSPYLHFGMLSPWRAMQAVDAAGVPARSAWKFHDELLTWREWSHYRARHVPDFHRYRGLPAPLREALDSRADDPRPDVCRFDDLLHGRTSSAVWNAAQRQWLVTGWMHNNLRMQWATQLLRLTPDPATAWATGCCLNDRLSIDGRDPATYASLRWAFGEGARSGGAPIYGPAPRKGSGALMRRAGMPAWIEAAAAADVPALSGDRAEAMLDAYR